MRLKTAEFKNNIDIINMEDELLASFNVSSLLTNVPINTALDLIYDCLKSDADLSVRFINFSDCSEFIHGFF